MTGLPTNTKVDCRRRRGNGVAGAHRFHFDTAGLKAAVSIASIIGETVQLRQSGQLQSGLCCFHNERTPSLHVYEDHYHCFGCGARGDVFTWLMSTRRMSFRDAVRWLGGVANHQRPGAPLKGRVPATDRAKPKNMDCARRIWNEATDPCGTPVETYLHHRGVRLPDEPVIRWHPQCPRGSGKLPAMIALMVDPLTGQPSGIHRTFLAQDGSSKAAGDKQKMMLGGAGVIKLAELAGEGLGLAEGIETALSAMQVIGWGPVWAASSSGGVEAFPVLPGHSLTIFADGDEPGLKAARACADRWFAWGLEVIIWKPPPGCDWNDAAGRFVQ